MVEALILPNRRNLKVFKELVLHTHIETKMDHWIEEESVQGKMKSKTLEVEI